jgi:hypothetical protein
MNYHHHHHQPHRDHALWTELAVGSSVMTFDRFFRHLIRLHQGRLQLDALGPTVSQAVGQRAVNLTVPRVLFFIPSPAFLMFD